MTQGELLISELKRRGTVGDLTYKEIQAIKTYDSPEQLKAALARFTPARGPEPQDVADWVEALTMTPEARWDAGRSDRLPWEYIVMGLAGAAFLSLGLGAGFGSTGMIVAGFLWVALAVVETVSGCAIKIIPRFQGTVVWRNVEPINYWFHIVFRWVSIAGVAVAFMLWGAEGSA